MDFNVFVLGLFVVLILMLAGLLKKNLEWAVFPGMATVIGVFLTLALLADGSLTNLSGGTAVVIASASTAGTSVWNFIEWTPIVFTLGSFLVAVYKVGSEF